MRDHIEKILRIGCIALGALLLFQIVRTVLHSNPLSKVTIPAVPTLGGNTNVTASAKSTNAPAVKPGTNAPAASLAKAASTNVPLSTNVVATAESNRPTASATVKENVSKAETNSVAATAPASTNENVSIKASEAGTNSVATSKPEKIATNSVTETTVSTNGTNAVVRSSSKKPSAPRSEIASMGTPGMGGGKPQAELSPAIKARVDRIYESELFGQVMRPQPAALMGIAGNSAFLRTSSGQTGLVKEGDSLGEMKLIRIGVNRVLVEEKGEKKELMIFNGYGGESLMAKQNETPNETTSK